MISPLVLIVSNHQAFAEAIRGQLHRLDAIVEIVSPGDFSKSGCRESTRAEVAFVDLDATTPDGTPLYRSFRSESRDCQVILLCRTKDTPIAVEAARNWDVFDYMLIDAVVDPYRAALLVERARCHCLPELPEIHAQEKRHYRQILGLLVELRAILKSRGNHPIVDAINRYRGEGSSLSLVDGGWLAGVYQHCLVDVICGRLKRLEHEFVLSCSGEQHEEKEERKPRILLVEDSEICADIAQRILESHGMDVTVAPTVEMARIALEKGTPSLIVMDIHLGAANGLRLLETLRRGGRCPDVPVIVCSADRMATTVKVAAKLNIQGYLLKPYVPSVLISKVTSVLAASAHETLSAERELVLTAS